MPTYKYRCENCGVFDHFSTPSNMIDKCPKCDGEINQIFTKPNIVFKQGAFYHKEAVD